ncbi:MAG: hypothetical protein V1837_05030 [Candidatus Woesearchaeota archaeon]
MPRKITIEQVNNKIAKLIAKREMLERKEDKETYDIDFTSTKQQYPIYQQLKHGYRGDIGRLLYYHMLNPKSRADKFVKDKKKLSPNSDPKKAQNLAAKIRVYTLTLENDYRLISRTGTRGKIVQVNYQRILEELFEKLALSRRKNKENGEHNKVVLTFMEYLIDRYGAEPFLIQFSTKQKRAKLKHLFSTMRGEVDDDESQEAKGREQEIKILRFHVVSELLENYYKSIQIARQIHDGFFRFDSPQLIDTMGAELEMFDKDLDIFYHYFVAKGKRDLGQAIMRKLTFGPKGERKHLDLLEVFQKWEFSCKGFLQNLSNNNERVLFLLSVFPFPIPFYDIRTKDVYCVDPTKEEVESCQKVFSKLFERFFDFYKLRKINQSDYKKDYMIEENHFKLLQKEFNFLRIRRQSLLKQNKYLELLFLNHDVVDKLLLKIKTETEDYLEHVEDIATVYKTK